MTLMDAQEGKVYVINRIATNDEELNAFLFSLGCYSGENITVVRKRKKMCVVSIKDSRYSMDSQLAQAIFV
ncbi:MAG: ferrous iron transport protein A [Ruminococcus sp.]|jgi:ferrous iron transport protein A|nr:ferrous iron transport protein A [Ruminococcus sp.]